MRGEETPEELAFWKTDDHELDFVLDAQCFLEVKRGRSGPVDFAWFASRFPKARLTVITTTPFESVPVRGRTMEDWLRDDG